jgi:integrase
MPQLCSKRGRSARWALLATMALAGLRVGEAAALRWRSVDLAGGTLRIERAKTHAGERKIDLSNRAR